jgi:hypothetical protein
MTPLGTTASGRAALALALGAAMVAGCGGGRRNTSPSSTGTAASSIAVIEVGGDTYAFVPNIAGVAKVKLGSGGSLAAPSTGDYRFSDPPPDACAADWNADRVVCGGYRSATVHVVDAVTMAIGSYPTGLDTAAAISAGTCVVCAMLYDPADDRMILATAGGYALFDHNGSHALGRTVAALPSENFGYDPTKNRVFSPRYGNGAGPSLDVVDIPGGKVYALDSPPPMAEPDHGAVDISTEIAIATEEAGAVIYLVDLSSASMDAPAAGSFQAPQAVIWLSSSIPGRLSGVAVEPGSHLAFLAADVGVTMAVAQLPTSRGDPLAVGDHVVAVVPATPTGSPWYGAGDPHGIAVFTLPGSSTPYGLLMNDSRRWLAVVDLQALLKAPRNATDANSIAPGHDLVTTGVVTFYPIPP